MKLDDLEDPVVDPAPAVLTRSKRTKSRSSQERSRSSTGNQSVTAVSSQMVELTFVSIESVYQDNYTS